MSGEPSPQTASHLPPSYTTSLSSTPTHMTTAPFPGSAQSFSSSDLLAKSESSEASELVQSAPPSSVPSSKGKNGATGPAEGKAKPHVCQICSRGFTTGGHLQRHQRIHTGVKAFKCPYPGCETRTSRQDNLQQHYRTHLSPTLRRGSGSAARAAVAAAMEAAGLKSSSSRAPRKSKSGGTPGSTTSSSAGHIPSPYGTPTSGPNPYVNPYAMYDGQQYAYPTHTMPPHGVSMAQTQSAASSRVPSPVNGHSGHSTVAGLPHQPYFTQPFSPAYGYPPSQLQGYRYPTGLASPYGAPPPHSLYSPGIASEHGQPHLYSPMQNTFPTHSRESSYGVLTPGYTSGPGPMANGYPPSRTANSTPLSASTGGGVGAPDDRRYAGASTGSPGRRRTPPDLLSQGIVDPNSMGRSMPGLPGSYGGFHTHPGPYAYGGGSAGSQVALTGGRDPTHRASISSASDGSNGAGSDAPAQKVMMG